MQLFKCSIIQKLSKNDISQKKTNQAIEKLVIYILSKTLLFISFVKIAK